MIDPTWLRRVVDYSEADTGGYDAEHLAMLLEDPAEVLPYLMTRAHAFAHWPKARAALATAAASAPRSGSAGAIGPDVPLSVYRAELYDVLHETLVESAANSVIPPKPVAVVDPKADPDQADIESEPEEPRPSPEHLLNLIKRVRFDEARGADSPSMFITAVEPGDQPRGKSRLESP